MGFFVIIHFEQNWIKQQTPLNPSTLYLVMQNDKKSPCVGMLRVIFAYFLEIVKKKHQKSNMKFLISLL